MKELQVTPRNKDSEEYVLGAIMLESGCLPLVIDKLHEDVFYFDLHRYVFRAIRTLYEKTQPIDIYLVIEQMKKFNLLNDTITPFAVVHLTNSVVSTANIEFHALILQQYYLQRESIRIGSDLTKRGYNEDPFDLMDSIAAEIMKLQESATKGSFKTIADHVYEVNKERDAIGSKDGVIGTSTGMKSLDAIISGLVPPDLIIIAARPGMGKTALALSIINHVAVVLSEPIGVFSLEMSESQLVTRLESIESGIDHELLRNGKLTDDERWHLSRADQRIASAPIYLDGSANINVREMRTKASIWKRKFGIKHIVVDYIQLMSGVNEKGKNREQVISEISRGLKVIGKELNCTVIALSQLSREVEKRPDKMPQLSDLRESGSIEQDADEVIFLMRPEYYESYEPVDIGGQEYSSKGLVITKIAKNRHGITKSIPLYFEGPKMRFKDTYEFMPDPSKFKQLRDFTEPASSGPF